jgi:hypothetical protein
MVTSLLIAFFAHEATLFWRQVGVILKTPQFKRGASGVALIAGLAPHLLTEFKSSAAVDRALWDLLAGEDVLTQQRVLLAVLCLSEGCDVFARSPEDGGIVLDLLASQALDRPELKMFRTVARLSLFCGGAIRNLEERFRDRCYVENFVTPNYVVSVIGEHHIVVRHGLGSAVYEVSDISTKRKKLIVDLSMDGHCDRPAPNEAYRSAFSDDDEFTEALDSLDRALSGETGFPKYIPPEPRRDASVAHSLLCDLGFLSADTHEMTRHVPPSLFDLLEVLDTTSARPSAVVFVLQIISGGACSELTSQETPALQALLADLQLPYFTACSLSFIAPARQAKPSLRAMTSLARQAGIIVVLNESGLRMNARCPEFEHFDVLIAVSMSGEDYAVELCFNNNLDVFGSFQISNVAITLRKENLSRFVAICAFLFFATPGRTLSNGCTQVKGPEHFMSGFYNRSVQIAQLFEKSQTGRNAILLGCLSCGLPQRK